jgi:N-acylglucosamine 2-epimerase
MKSAYWQKWNKLYRQELIENIMPFWLKHGLDKKHGGVYTCLDRDGSLMDTTKSVWFQGRFGWMCAYAYNHVKKDKKWLAASLSCCEFLEKYCFDKDGRAFFEITEDGVGLRKRRYVFSECFAAIAYAEYALASGDKAWAEKAVELFKRIRKFVAGGKKWMPSKYTDALKAQGHSLTMILINVAAVLKGVIEAPELDEQIDNSINDIERYLMNEEYKTVLELVGPNGELIDTCAGRTINPGHCIETAWFILAEAKRRGWDERLTRIGLKIYDWAWAWGWDEEFGGIINFRDCKGFPPQDYSQDMKFWWPQCEAIIASLYCYEATGDESYLEKFRMAHEWAYAHLKDNEMGEWYGYLHRDGSVAQPAKGNIFKGPFHVPRMLIEASEMIGEITRK